MGTEFMFFTQRMARLRNQFDVAWSLENPVSSFIWVMPPILELAQMPQVQTITLDMCRFGSPHKKPTSIMADFSLQALAKTCNMADQPHQHEPLVGTIVINGKKIFRTKLAQVYPDKLCTEWADLAATGTSQDPLAATFALTTPTSDRKRPVGELVPWKPHK